MKVGRKLLIPIPMQFSTARQYFSHFFTTNKENNASFSFQYWAKKIQWPTSYLSDLISGRKNLTVLRALQFSDYCKMNAINREQLLYFALAGSNAQEVADFAKIKLQNDPVPKIFEKYSGSDLGFHNDLLCVLKVLIWKRKKLSPEEILGLLQVPSLSCERISKALTYVEQNKLLKWDANGKMITKDFSKIPIAFDNYDARDEKPFEGIELHKESALNFIQFVMNPKRPASYNSGWIAIPKNQFMPVALKILELRNWILEISQQHLVDSDNPDETSYFMQYDLNLFPLQKNLN